MPSFLEAAEQAGDVGNIFVQMSKKKQQRTIDVSGGRRTGVVQCSDDGHDPILFATRVSGMRHGGFQPDAGAHHYKKPRCCGKLGS